MTEDNAIKQNRKYKDSIFVDLFGYDKNAKANFLSLYNALHETNLNLNEIEIVPQMLENVLYMAYYNDVAMLVDGRLVVLVEHQSTLNENMPLRMLDYVTRIYERLIPARDKFKKNLIKIPRPEFFVLYNGESPIPEQSEQKLSSAFENGSGINLELTVKIFNINSNMNKDLLSKCAVLHDYSEFVSIVRRFQKEGNPDPFGNAIKSAVKQGILQDYLERKSTEVINMLMCGYDYDTDIAVQREEARDSMCILNIRAMMKNLKCSVQQALDVLDIKGADRAKYIALISN